MAKGVGQKLKLLYLVKILSEQTDEQHPMNGKELMNALSEYGIEVERKTFYDDIHLLQDFGYDIVSVQANRTNNYYMASRQFELPELKLLVDSVQASKFITEKKSQELIDKLSTLTSKNEADSLRRQVYMYGRPKTSNEKIYYNVDVIHRCIAENVKIQFKYFEWNEKKEQILRHDGQEYKVSPWALSWADENYYLVGYDKKDEKIKHYRVDKMLDAKLCDREYREGREQFNGFDMAAYSKKMFSMYEGGDEMVTLECDNRFAGILIDRFGSDVNFVPVDKDHFQVHVKVSVSRQFFGWILALGSGIKIVGPSSVVEQFRDVLTETTERYE